MRKMTTEEKRILLIIIKSLVVLAESIVSPDETSDTKEEFLKLPTHMQAALAEVSLLATVTFKLFEEDAKEILSEMEKKEIDKRYEQHFRNASFERMVTLHSPSTVQTFFHIRELIEKREKDNGQKKNGSEH